MFCKNVLICFCFISITSGDRSFTIVLDITKSMQEELDAIQANLAPILYAVGNQTNIVDYIMVPFNDDIQQPFVSSTRKDFLAKLNTLTVSGGRACPENSLAGIERALQISKPQSFVFVFTDAYSKDPQRLESIQNLCKTTNSQVIIFLSGLCLQSPSSPVNDVNVYYDVASSCSGAVLRFDASNLRQAFKSMMSLSKVEWTEVYNYGTFENNKQFSFAVDAFTKNIMIAVSGEAPIVNISAADGQSQQTEKLVESRHTQILSVTATNTGNRTVSIRCRGRTSAILFLKHDLPIKFGFSTKQPRSLRETARRPMPGMTNYVLIHITDDNLELQSVEIQVIDEEEKHKINTENTYFFEPNKAFRIWIKGYDKLSLSEITGATSYMMPQTAETVTSWKKTATEIVEIGPVTVDYGTNRVVACKVNGYPKPNIWWENKDQTIPSEHVLLEMPSVYISYVTMVNVTENSTLYCKSQNSEGTHSQSVDVLVYRPYSFEVIQTPSDETIEYGGNGTLTCKVAAYPEATIKWYYKDDLLTQANDLQIKVEDDTLRITNMSLDNVGNFRCEIMNEVKNVSYNAYVNISGIEKPKIEADNSEIVLKLGDLFTLECRVTKGKPTPVITWQYKAENDLDFGDIPDGVETVKDGKLKMASVQTNHKGVYRCKATNVEGTDFAEIIVKLRYPPTISNSSARSVVVREGQDVTLACDARGAPAPRVHWELRRGDSRLPLNAAHTADTSNISFNALWNNSGDYHCIAENELGRDEMTINVTVLVPVFIEPPKLNTIVLRAGASVVLDCNVLFGNPVPSIKWKFIASDSRTTVISRGSSTVRLDNVSRANGGSYLCVAENEVSTDSISIDVKVQ